MRILSQSWSNFSKGYKAALEMEHQARENWQSNWQKAIEFAQRQGEKKAFNLIQLQILAEKRLLRISLVALAATVMLMAALSSLSDSFPQLQWVILPARALNFMQALVLILPIVDKLKQIATLRRQQVKAETPTVELDVAEQWWQSVSDEQSTVNNPQQFDFLHYLSRNLPDEYIAIHSLLVKQSLDVDVLVIGPTGIWIFEVNHWQGRVTCRNGVWKHEGGSQPGSSSQADDERWLDERNNIENTLNVKLARNARLGTLLRGGLVFTHPNVVLDIDKSARAEYGTPGQWLQRMKNAQKIQQFSTEVQLLILDTLLDYALSLYVTRPVVNSAVDLAKLLYGDLLEDMRQYILRQIRSQAAKIR